MDYGWHSDFQVVYKICRVAKDWKYISLFENNWLKYYELGKWTCSKFGTYLFAFDNVGSVVMCLKSLSKDNRYVVMACDAIGVQNATLASGGDGIIESYFWIDWHNWNKNKSKIEFAEYVRQNRKKDQYGIIGLPSGTVWCDEIRPVKVLKIVD